MFKILILSIFLSVQYKTVIKIESCTRSGRCRVYFDDNSTDLMFNPYIGMKVRKWKK